MRHKLKIARGATEKKLRNLAGTRPRETSGAFAFHLEAVQFYLQRPTSRVDVIVQWTILAATLQLYGNAFSLCVEGNDLLSIYGDRSPVHTG